MTISQQFILKLMAIGAIKVNAPADAFTWASGWKSPIYCDNRKGLSYPETRDFIEAELQNMYMKSFGDAEVIAGVATAGIPWGYGIARDNKKPFAYVRAESKKHGLGNQIEGVIEAGQKVVVIEDLISTGKSTMQAVKAIQDAGGVVIGVLALFTYGFSESQKAFSDANLACYTISNYKDLLELGKKEGFIKHEDIEVLTAWSEDPSRWDPMAV